MPLEEEYSASSSHYPVLTFDEYLSTASNPDSPGFGKLQVLSIAMLFLVKFSASIISNNIGFMQMVPSFDCTSTTNSTKIDGCLPAAFCPSGSGLDYEVDWASQYTIANMITKFQMYCSSHMSIVLLGESIKAGFLIYLFLFSHLMDRWGRRAVMVRGLVIQSSLLIALICCPGGSPWA